MLLQGSAYTFILLLALTLQCLADHDPVAERRNHEWLRKVAMISFSAAPPSGTRILQVTEEEEKEALLKASAVPPSVSERLEIKERTPIFLKSFSAPSTEPRMLKVKEEKETPVSFKSSSVPPSGPRTLQIEEGEEAEVLFGSLKKEEEREEKGEKLEKREDPEKGEREGNITLSRDVLAGLLQEVALYLKVDRLLVLYPRGNRDVCVGAAMTLYRKGQPTTCRPHASTPTDSPFAPRAVVYVADRQDGLVGFPGLWTREDSSQLVLVLPTPPSSSLSLPPSPAINICVIYPRGPVMEFVEVFTFGDEGGGSGGGGGSGVGGRGKPLVSQPVWAWQPGRPTDAHTNAQARPPYRGNTLAPHDFMGNVVRVAVIQSRPYVIFGSGKDGVQHPAGYLVDILEVLQRQLNFTIRYVEAKDKEFGLRLPNGTWTGLVGVLQRKDADVALGGLSRLVSRTPVMDFSPAIDYSSLRVLVYTAAEGEALDWHTYTNVFHWSVWLALVGVWITASVGVVVVSRPEPSLTIYNYLFSFAGAYAQQGSEVQPESGRGRVVFWGLWAGSVLLYASYTALLTSRLAVVPRSKPFTDLLDALTSAGFSIAVQGGTSYIAMMETSRDAGQQLLYKRVQEDRRFLVEDNDEGLTLIRSGGGKVGFLQDLNSVNYDLRGDCSFSWVGPMYFPEYTYLGYRKHLPYATALSTYIARAADVGITDKLRAKWWEAGGGSCSSATQSFNTLGFSKVVFAFLFLALGILAGWLVLLAELWVNRAVSSSSSSSSSSSFLSSLLRQLGRKRHRHWGKRHNWSEWWGEDRNMGKGSGEMRYKGRGSWSWDEEAGHRVKVVDPYLPHLRHLPPPPRYTSVVHRY